MLTLATGNPDPGRVSREQGMTLIEVLLVVVIIAVMASAVLLSLNASDQGWLLKREARRVIALIDAQCDAAMLDAIPRALTIEDQGYLFEQFDGRQWWPVDNDRVFRPHQVPEGMSLSLQLEQGSELGEAVEQRIICVASGEMSPFVMSLQGREQQQTVRGTLNGRLSLDAEMDQGP